MVVVVVGEIVVLVGEVRYSGGGGYGVGGKVW